MPDAFKSRPDETAKLKRLVSRMDQEITSLTYQVEKLKTGLAGHRKARFGSKSGSLDQLALDLIGKYCDHLPLDRQSKSSPARRLIRTAPR